MQLICISSYLYLRCPAARAGSRTRMNPPRMGLQKYLGHFVVAFTEVHCSCEAHWFPWQVAGKRGERRGKSDFELPWAEKKKTNVYPNPNPIIQWHIRISPVVITSVSKEETRRVAGFWYKPGNFSCLMLPVAGAHSSAMLHTPREVTPVSHFLLSLVTINH